MSKEQFLKDLEIGEYTENKIVSFIKIKYPKAYKHEGEFKDYDIRIPEKDITIEVKTDIGSAESDNYFIEFSCNGVDSGINSTKANYWIICDETDIIWIKTSMLKSVCVIEGVYWKGKPKGCNSIVESYLVNKHKIRERAEKVTRKEKYGL